MTTTAAPRAYSPREVGDALGIHESTVRIEIRRGALPAVRVGRLLRIPEGALDDYLAGRQAAKRRGGNADTKATAK